MNKVHVVGVGMIPFHKPGASDPYHSMGAQAARLALEDAGVDYECIQQVHVGYVFGDSSCGQTALYGVGLTGIPIINVNNYCATGSTALYLARQAVAGGTIECALALGFEEMQPGALGWHFSDRPNPLFRHEEALWRDADSLEEAPTAARFFGGAGREYQVKYGTRPETFAKIAEKARRHAARNSRALFRHPISVEEILASSMVYAPLTRLQCCPPTSGAAAAVLCTPDFARRHGLDARVTIAAQAMTSDRSSTFDDDSLIKLVGYDMTREAARRVYEAAGIGPEDIDVVELHDCFTTYELITYEALELTPEGSAERFIWDGANTYGGKVVVNPSGGLLSKGHPLGATGLAQCAELVWQLRGQAGARQVEGARLALQHNIGLGGACVVTLYSAG